MQTTLEKSTLIHALGEFIGKRSGIDGRNYDSRESFMRDCRRILRDGKHARRLLDYVSRRSISAEDLIASSKSAFSGRLSFDEIGVDYVTGQYFATEYRAAACAVLARAVWDYYRTGCNYSPEQIRNAARREFGRAIASAWF